jgi:hypothetical protein
MSANPPKASPAAPPWRQGLRAGLNRSKGLAWFLIKTILPLYVATEILKASGLLTYISSFLAPVMGLFGLPAEAAAVLTAGFLVNLYAAAAVAVPLGLNWVQVSVIGLILGIAHSLVVEGAVVRGLVPGRHWHLTALRLGLGLGAGLALAQLLKAAAQ